MELKDIKAAVLAAVETKTAELSAQMVELKQLNADLEAKMGEKAVVVADVEAFDMKAANVALISAFTGESPVEIKALTIAGGGGESLAIAEELGRNVIEQARENVAILGLVGSKTVGSVNYRELVLKTFPATAEEGENTTLSGADWSATSTQTYVEVSMKVGKQYAKPQITDEAVNDPHIDIFAHLNRLLADELGRYWAQQVLGGDGSTNQIKGILTDAATGGHLDTRDFTTDGTKGESWKDVANRDSEIFPIIPTEVAAAFPATSLAFMDKLIDMTVAVPSKYLANSSWTMNRRSLGEIRKLRDGQERPLIQFESGAFSLLGHPISLEDYMPSQAAEACPIIFGDLKAAYYLCDIDETYLIDPYSVDGAVQVKTSSRKGSMIGNNDAIVILICTDKDGE